MIQEKREKGKNYIFYHPGNLMILQLYRIAYFWTKISGKEGEARTPSPLDNYAWHSQTHVVLRAFTG